MTKLEEAARAMAKADYPDREWGFQWFSRQQMDLYLDHATAALQALLPPSAEMVEAGGKTCSGHPRPETITAIFTAMIAAIQPTTD